MNLDLNAFPGQHKRHKHGHAAAVRSGRSARQAVAAIDQFFDGEKQAVSVAPVLDNFATLVVLIGVIVILSKAKDLCI